VLWGCLSSWLGKADLDTVHLQGMPCHHISWHHIGHTAEQQQFHSTLNWLVHALYLRPLCALPQGEYPLHAATSFCCCCCCCNRDQWNFTLLPTSRSQDPTGAYIKRWVPELAGLPPAHIHTPWTAPAADLEAAGVVLGHNYPHRCGMCEGASHMCSSSSSLMEGVGDWSWLACVAHSAAQCLMQTHMLDMHQGHFCPCQLRLCHHHGLLLCVAWCGECVQDCDTGAVSAACCQRCRNQGCTCCRHCVRGIDSRQQGL
jgi:hypothetical protein